MIAALLLIKMENKQVIQQTFWFKNVATYTFGNNYIIVILT